MLVPLDALDVSAAETVFDVLRTLSQNRNIPVRQVAADLLDKPIHPTTTPHT